MFFKNTNDKIYNLDNKKQKIIKNLIKEDIQLNDLSLNELINLVALYHNNKFRQIPAQLYDNNGDLIDVSKESKELLLEIFNIDELYKMIDENSNYEKEKFEKNDVFRRNIMNAALYQIIMLGGKEKGPEYGLIFAKMFNYDIEVPMQYASYDGIYDVRFIKYVDTYLGLGGSNSIFWLPNYFSENKKDKYVMEPLYEITDRIKEYINKSKVNSIN